MGLLGESRSPENQQSRGSCPGAPAPGNPEGRASWGPTEQSQINVPWPPFLALGRHCPQLSPGGWATALNSFTQADCPSQGRPSSECLLSAWGAPPWGSRREHYTGSWAQDSSYCSVFVSCECVLHSLVPLFCHPSNGQGPSLSLPCCIPSCLACDRCSVNICQMK